MYSGQARRIALFAALMALYLAAASFVGNAYYQLILTSIPIWATMATAWNVFSGYTGLLSFGHAAFFGIGAFVVTLLFIQFDITPWIGIPLAGVAGALCAVIIGLPTFRLRGHYFALAMVAYPFALLYVFNWLGYQEVTLPWRPDEAFAYMQFTNPFHYTALAILLLFVAMCVASYVDRSRFGLTLRAIKQDEAAAQASGIDPLRWKMAAFMLSGMLAALAGGLYVVVLSVTTPNEVFGLIVSSTPLVLTLLGGIGSLWGPVIGAILLVPLSETLHAELGSVLPGIQGVVYGLAILVITLWLPEGIYWKFYDLFHRSRRSAPVRTDAASVSGLSAPGLLTGQTAHDGTVPAVSVRGLGCTFGSLRAVDRVSFDVERGSITGLVGPNGAGKTTLFNLINGFASASEGEIRLFGDPITSLSISGRARRGVARTFQTPRVFPRLTVRENVQVGAFSIRANEQETCAAIDWAIQHVGLGAVSDELAGSLTAGDTRLLEIARALASCPKVLLLDETLAGLSSVEVDQVVDVIRRIRDLGVTVVIIEHTMSAMVALVDRMIVLNQGRLIADAAPEAVVSDRSVIEAYLGKKWANRA